MQNIVAAIFEKESEGYRGLDCSVSDVLLDTMRCVFQWEEDELKQ